MKHHFSREIENTYPICLISIEQIVYFSLLYEYIFRLLLYQYKMIYLYYFIQWHTLMIAQVNIHSRFFYLSLTNEYIYIHILRSGYGCLSIYELHSILGKKKYVNKLFITFTFLFFLILFLGTVYKTHSIHENNTNVITVEYTPAQTWSNSCKEKKIWEKVKGYHSVLYSYKYCLFVFSFAFRNRHFQ